MYKNVSLCWTATLAACRHVVIASMAGVVPSPGQAAYSAAKAGVRAYFASVAAELADKWVAKWGRGR